MTRLYNKLDNNYPKEAIYIGRLSKWGNPFKIGINYQGQKLDRDKCITAYLDWFYYSDKGIELQKDLNELKGKDLLCWCTPLPCHGDILLIAANLDEITKTHIKDN